MARTILVVDDSVTMVMSLKTTLSLNGFQAETAGNGREALEKLQAGLRPDLILTDINMPVMSGLELIRSVRAMPGLKFIPILTLTTESALAKKNEGRITNADDIPQTGEKPHCPIRDRRRHGAAERRRRFR
jgi:two-component system, chemotaxis family, chemotaxis protein CheY